MRRRGERSIPFVYIFLPIHIDGNNRTDANDSLQLNADSSCSWLKNSSFIPDDTVTFIVRCPGIFLIPKLSWDVHQYHGCRY